MDVLGNLLFDLYGEDSLPDVELKGGREVVASLLCSLFGVIGSCCSSGGCGSGSWMMPSTELVLKLTVSAWM